MSCNVLKINTVILPYGHFFMHEFADTGFSVKKIQNSQKYVKPKMSEVQNPSVVVGKAMDEEVRMRWQL